MKRLEKDEYAYFYETYVSLVNEIDIISAMKEQAAELIKLFAPISDEQGLYSYAEGKWTIKELLGHLIDGERVFVYRAFRFARKDKTPLPGFDQNPYIANANYNSVPINSLLRQLLLLRESNVLFFESLPESAWDDTGIASKHEITVRALAYICVGHIRHHTNILTEKYLQNI